MSNSRERLRTLPISGNGLQGQEYKPAEVRIFSRKNITIDRSNVGADSFNWFQYKHVQSINIPTSHTITSDGQYDFGYDIALDGDTQPFLAISAPSEKTVFLYKWVLLMMGLNIGMKFILPNANFLEKLLSSTQGKWRSNKNMYICR